MWPEGDKTQELLKGVADGEPSAVNRLMERHRDAIRRMVQMRLDQAIARRVDAVMWCRTYCSRLRRGCRITFAALRCRFIFGCGNWRRTASLTCIVGIEGRSDVLSIVNRI